MKNLLSLKKLPHQWKLVTVGLLIGIVTSFITILFYISLHSLSDWFFSLDKYWYLIFPAIGAFLSAILIYNFAPEAEGHGIDAVAKSFHKEDGKVPFKVSIIKAISSILTMGLGGSGGVEGPIAQIGTGVGSTIARKLKFPTSDVRSLMLAGCAAGIGSIFKAPLGGAFASIEVIYREDFEARAMVPAIVSSVVGYFIYSSFIVGGNVLDLPDASFINSSEIPAYLLLTLACMLSGYLFTKTFFAVQNLSKRLKIKKVFKPLLGGLVVGLIGFFFKGAIGATLDPLVDIATNSFSLRMIFFLLIFKLIATCFTIGTGGSGGVFGPSLFIGGLTGALLHKILIATSFPIALPSQTAFIMVGMSGFFSGVAKAPIGALIMACEMTGSFKLLIPLLIVNIITTVLSHGFGIYKNQVEDRFHSPIYLKGVPEFILQNIPITHIFIKNQELKTISQDITIEELRKLIKSPQGFFPIPVVDKEQALVGILSLGKLVEELKANNKGLVKDIMTVEAYCYPDHTLHDAVSKFKTYHYSRLPVIDKKTKKVIGRIQWQDIFNTYANVPTEKFEQKAKVKRMEH